MAWHIQSAGRKVWQSRILYSLKLSFRTSLMVQLLLRICLPMQGTWVWYLVREDHICRRAADPMCHNCWAHMPRACVPQHRKPLCSREDLVQPKKEKNPWTHIYTDTKRTILQNDGEIKTFPGKQILNDCY